MRTTLLCVSVVVLTLVGFSADDAAAVPAYTDSELGVEQYLGARHGRRLPDGYGRSGYDDETFVTDSGYDLDQYLYDSDGPLEFDIEVDRVFSRNSADWDQIIKEARLVLRVWDVDEEVQPDWPPELLPERDYVYINGHVCPRDETGTGDHLTGANNTWSVWKFQIPVEWFENGWIHTATWQGDGQEPEPGINHISIDIDVLMDHTWAVECDWGRLEIVGMRPSLLVHGLKSDQGAWEHFQTYVDGGLFECARMPSVGNVSGNSQRVASEFDSMMVAFGVHSGNVVAHSKGGLDTRYWVEHNNSSVENLVMLGTPNHGTEYANHVIETDNWLHRQAERILSPAIHDLRTSTWIMGEDPRSASESYHTIGGDRFKASETKCPLFCGDQLFNEDNDTFVPLSRAAAPGQTEVDVRRPHHHFDLPKRQHMYDTWIRSWLCASETTRKASISLLLTEYVPPGRRAKPESPHRFGQDQGTTLIERVLTAGGSLDEPLMLDLCSEAIFLATGTSELCFELMMPNGTVVDPDYADSHADIEFHSGEGVFAAYLGTYTISNPAAGAWRVLISAGSTASVALTAALTSELVLEGTVSSDQMSQGSVLDIAASLTDGASPVTGASVEAALKRNDGYQETVVLTSTGGGNYEASHICSEAGQYEFCITASGTSRTAFEREISTSLLVTPTGGEIGDVGSDYGADTNGNGLYDELIVPVTVEASAPDSFLLSAALEAPGGAHLGSAGAYLRCSSAGIYTVNLQFDGRSINEAGLDGPYTLRDLLLEQKGRDGLVVDEVEQTFQTAPYECDQFERPPIRFTGIGSESVDDDDQDGLYDSMTIGIGIELTETSNYSWNARLEDQYGGDIGWSSSSGNLEAGARTIDLTFEGLAICGHGVDGPYFLRDLYIYSLDQYGNDALMHDIYETAYYPFDAFEHPPTDFVLLEHTLACSVGEPFVGQDVLLSVDVVNVGDDCDLPVLLRFMYSDSTAIAEIELAPLGFGDVAHVTTDWVTPVVPGDHSIHVHIDPDNVLTEYLESNNNGTLTVAVRDRVQEESVLVDGVVRRGEQEAAVLLDLSRSEPVRITLYDMSGVLVRTLHEGTLTSGRRTLSWDLRNDDGQLVASGTYLCIVDIGGKMTRERISVLR